MIVHLIHILLVGLLLVALVSADNSNSASDDSSLWDMVPDCARTCVSNFIDAQYTESECPDSTNIKCLCRHKTPSGLTLGEAALSCTYALCDDKTMKDANAYQICDSVPGAISETHATITATTFPKKTTTKTQPTTTTTNKDSPISNPASEAPGITTFDPTTSKSESKVTSTSTSDPDLDSTPKTTSLEHSSSPSQTQTSPTPTNTSESDDNGGHHGVSAGTVIGVSVASGVAGSFLIAVAVFFWCKRWRQQRRNSSEPDSDFFEIGGTMTEPPGFSEASSRRSTPDPGPGPGPSSFNTSARQPEISEPQRSFRPGSQYPPTFAAFPTASSWEQVGQRKRERIGFAVSSASDWADSPRSQTSQAPFPDTIPNQGPGLYPKPLKWSHRPTSGETLFEEEEESQMPSIVTAAYQKPNMTQKPGSPRLMPGLPANPRALKDGFPADRFRRAPAGPQLNTHDDAHSRYPLGVNPEPRGRTPAPLYNPKNTQRASYTSNSSGTQNYSSDCSQDTTSNTLLTTPGRPEPIARKPSPGTATLAPPAEIVSRPRIVRGDDIKRVHVRSSPRPRPPSEGSAPWGPEDLWLQRGRTNASPPQASPELPYPSERCPGVVLYPSSPKKQPPGMPQGPSPTGRNLTPSKRGTDLILRVD
ncbi:hypothetical protein N7509_009226 [Penicillium cosmopolitanum]|uniref:Extracellular membrane protein CFEM domain-containing protein n=1 Tax=Penicillium cosmopolitanum TaxID=1131564 RepID=A0A9W9VP33_9EURO|nr:uncharacterized protein N7509_009226 [Penicillium cosmopolitanum]KAJ5386685.1 hypothetical protein N7509_009226 [Penicillium cosmopolitanum]